MAVVSAGSRRTLLDLGAMETVVEELGWLRFSLARVARASGERDRAARGYAAVEASAGRLDKLLGRPILDQTGDRALVVVPTGSLQHLPWSILPSFRGLAVVVAPSLATWHALASRPASRAGARVLVAGPRLRHARSEVRSIARLHPEATVLEGNDATAARVLRALDGAALAHIACHGRFRADSPLFSSFELADGPLNAYELQRLRRPPQHVVLSACDLALSSAQPGDELLGLAAALLGIGTRTVVASAVPVPDAVARRLTLAFHRNLSEGNDPAFALARAQANLIGSQAAVAGFLCLGRG
jgi:CHAT domain-containing protein